MTDLRAAAQQALEALEKYRKMMFVEAGCRFGEGDAAITNLRAALAQQAEPVAGKVVAWGVFANIDGEWQLQHPVFAGDEQGKVNAEFERASYSGPQPLEVRPLGVVTATARQAEPAQEPVATLIAQRDALLEMLKLARSIIGHPDDAHSQMIDAAIKAVEEEA
jgi:hypothetical protein